MSAHPLHLCTARLDSQPAPWERSHLEAARTHSRTDHSARSDSGELTMHMDRQVLSRAGSMAAEGAFTIDRGPRSASRRHAACFMCKWYANAGSLQKFPWTLRNRSTGRVGARYGGHQIAT